MIDGIRLQQVFFIGSLSLEKQQKYNEKLLNESHVYGDLVQDWGLVGTCNSTQQILNRFA